MNKTYEQIIEARKKGARKIRDYGFTKDQQNVALVIKNEALGQIGLCENALSDEGDYAIKVPTAETLAKIVYRIVISGRFENVESNFLMADVKHVRFLTKEFLEGVCQWYAEYALSKFDDWGCKYETY